MWTKGTITLPNGNKTETTLKYWVKHFEEPNETYGIDGGRISKLTIKTDGQVTCSYERGWAIEPEGEATQLAYAILMEKYN